MRWRAAFYSVILASAFFASSVARGPSRAEELGPLPIALSLERFQQIALLSPGSNLGNARLLQQAQWRRAAAIGPVYGQMEGGPRYWWEIARTGEDSFDLTNRETKETVTLAYSGVRAIGIAKAHPRTHPQSPAEKTLQGTGDIIGTILPAPVRIPELFLVPQC